MCFVLEGMCTPLPVVKAGLDVHGQLLVLGALLALLMSGELVLLGLQCVS